MTWTVLDITAISRHRYRCGYIPCMAGPSKIIYDKSSGQMCV